MKRRRSRRDIGEGRDGGVDLGPPVTLDDLGDDERSATFESYELSSAVKEALAAGGFVDPTPVQRLAIPRILAGRDLIAQAETGTGKTIAFGAPLVTAIDAARRSVQALVLAPTRELAQQVAGVIDELGRPVGLRVVLVVGGVQASDQALDMAAGAQVVVGTPGRVLDLSNIGTLNLGWVEYAVLDEADRMLDIGFLEDVGKILARLPLERRTLMFSATVPPACARLARRYMTDPVVVRTTVEASTVPEIAQRYAEMPFNRRLSFVMDLIRARPEGSFLIFCNTKREVRFLDRELWGRGFEVHGIHGDQEQEMRFKLMENFRDGKVRVMVATDVASRGLDIDRVGHVINWDVPPDSDTYLHRIGRTGRAGRSGEVVTIVTPESRGAFEAIRRRIGAAMELVSSHPEAGRHAPGGARRTRGGGRSRGR